MSFVGAIVIALAPNESKLVAVEVVIARGEGVASAARLAMLASMVRVARFAACATV